jgi:hypothetical protein
MQVPVPKSKVKEELPEVNESIEIDHTPLDTTEIDSKN